VKLSDVESVQARDSSAVSVLCGVFRDTILLTTQQCTLRLIVCVSELWENGFADATS
jgi:hypothetical protein